MQVAVQLSFKPTIDNAAIYIHTNRISGLEQPLHKWSGIFTGEVHAKTGVYPRKF